MYVLKNHAKMYLFVPPKEQFTVKQKELIDLNFPWD